MATQIKYTKFGDTIVTKQGGKYSFDAPVETTAGFSVRGAGSGSGDQAFSVNNSGDIYGNSLYVTGGISACGLDVCCGAFKVNSCGGDVYVKDELSIVDKDGNIQSTVNNYGISLSRPAGSGNSGDVQVFDVSSCGLNVYDYSGNSFLRAERGYLSVCGYTSGLGMPQSVFDVSTCGGLNLYNGSGNQVFSVYDGSLFVCGYDSNTKYTVPVFNVSTCGGLNLYNESGYSVLQAWNGNLYVCGYSSGMQYQQTVFSVNNTCGLNLYDDSGQTVFHVSKGYFNVNGYDWSSSGYYTMFTVDSCGIYMNLGNVSGHIITTTVQGSGGSLVTVLTLG